MSGTQATPAQGQSPPPTGARQLLAADGWPALALGAATLAASLGTYAVGRLSGAGPLGCCLAQLAAATVWVALAAPVAAASGSSGIGSLLRAGAVADASAIALLVLHLVAKDPTGRPYVTILAAAEIYCTHAALALFAVAAARLPRKPAARYAASVAAAAVLLAALAGPFWINGILATAEHRHAQFIAAWAMRANPFYSISSAVAERTGFVWHSAPLMYRITRLGDFVAAPPVAWYASACIYGLAACALGLVAVMRRAGRRRQVCS